MGYRLNFIIEREYIDHDHKGIPYYSEQIHVGGSSITDTVYFKQNGNVVGFTIHQFLDMLRNLRQSSIWNEIETEDQA